MPCNGSRDDSITVSLSLAGVIDRPDTSTVYDTTVLVDILAALFEQSVTADKKLIRLDRLG